MIIFIVKFVYPIVLIMLFSPLNFIIFYHRNILVYWITFMSSLSSIMFMGLKDKIRIRASKEKTEKRDPQIPEYFRQSGGILR